MMSDSISAGALQPDADERLFDDWFDPIENAVRDRVRCFIEELIEGELAAVLARPRYGRRAKDGDRIATSVGVAGHRHGSRTRMLTGTVGRPKSPCRGRGLCSRTAARGNGRARFCVPISAARARPRR